MIGGSTESYVDEDPGYGADAEWEYGVDVEPDEDVDVRRQSTPARKKLWWEDIPPRRRLEPMVPPPRSSKETVSQQQEVEVGARKPFHSEPGVEETVSSREKPFQAQGESARFCSFCGNPVAGRSQKKYCSSACRLKASRKAKKDGKP